MSLFQGRHNHLNATGCHHYTCCLEAGSFEQWRGGGLGACQPDGHSSARHSSFTMLMSAVQENLHSGNRQTLQVRMWKILGAESWFISTPLALENSELPGSLTDCAHLFGNSGLLSLIYVRFEAHLYACQEGAHTGIQSKPIGDFFNVTWILLSQLPQCGLY